ncbi:hypothetical protein ILYODFUR_014400 [Ilyodon furcidens]|uniref:Uncharacterized protein n=1 Tax=Ilyodon furcidens TaxID=33524 RepID=A0ABV0TJN5_9TELE
MQVRVGTPRSATYTISFPGLMVLKATHLKMHGFYLEVCTVLPNWRSALQWGEQHTLLLTFERPEFNVACIKSIDLLLRLHSKDVVKAWGDPFGYRKSSGRM